jgi:hypothetical protein
VSALIISGVFNAVVATGLVLMLYDSIENNAPGIGALFTVFGAGTVILLEYWAGMYLIDWGWLSAVTGALGAGAGAVLAVALFKPETPEPGFSDVQPTDDSNSSD